MRVLHVIPSISPREGGPSHAVLAMVRALLARGVESEIATTEIGGAVPEGLPVHFSPRIIQGPPLVRRLGYAPGFAPWLRKHLPQYACSTSMPSFPILRPWP